jgi:hypothetical protein
LSVDAFHESETAVVVGDEEVRPVGVEGAAVSTAGHESVAATFEPDVAWLPAAS